MFRNFFTIAYRNLLRHKFYAIINITGLAIGIACFALIFLFITDELSYDKFHSKANRIYRVVGKLETDGQGERSSSCVFPLSNALKTDYPQFIEESVRFFNFQEQSHTLQFAEKKINEKNTFFADSTVFKIFDYSLQKGDREQALAKPNSIVLSQELARKYFGEEDPMGKTMKFDGATSLMVTGVFDPLPEQTHMHFDALISFSTLRSSMGPNLQSKNWVWNPCWTYILLKEGTDKKELEKQFPVFIDKYYPEHIKHQASHNLQALTDIHLTSDLDYEIEPNSSRSSIYIFSAIAVFILVIASINFMNLATARSAGRAKEVGIRKVSGAHRRQLILQFLNESVLMAIISVLLAMVFVEVLLPLFNAISAKNLQLNVFSRPYLLLGMFGVGIFTGLLSGLYPAFFLSSFNTVKVLKGDFKAGSSGKFLRKGLVIGQFSISIILIICTAIIYNQMRYMQSADTGFNRDEILVMHVRPPMAKQVIPFVQEIKKNKNILNVATMNDIIGERHNTHEFNYEGMEPGKWVYFPALMVNETFVETFDIKLVAGRGFSKEMRTDDSLSVIINEAMVKHLNWGTPENALGKQFYTPFGKEKVIGVAQDFNFVSLVHDVGPFVLDIPHKYQRVIWTKYLAIRVGPDELDKTLAFIDAKWSEFVKDYPLEYFFLKDDLQKQYKAQDNLSKLVGYFAVLAIFIACLGLFALAAFTAEQRSKEIGIRKVLGASTYSVTSLLSKDFLKLVIFSNLLAWPLSYFLMYKWLQGFAYKTAIDWKIFLVASLSTLLIALVTVIFQAVKAALSNPVSTLKYE